MNLLNLDNWSEVNRKQKPTPAIWYPWLDILPYLSALIQMENISSNYEYGLQQRHRPRIYSGSKCAGNTLRNCISKYQQLKSKIRPTLSGMVVCVQQNPIPLSQGYKLLEHLIRAILMPKPPEFGVTCRKTNRRASHREPPLFLIDTQQNQDWFLLMYWALNPKPIYLSRWKTTEIIK